jgi:DNA-binding transcriptional ArsR family regulator
MTSSAKGKKNIAPRCSLYYISSCGELTNSTDFEKENTSLKEFIGITKALADSNRVRALMALRGGELCACQLIELLGLAPSTVSKHMSVLKQAGLVLSRKTERWMYYRLPLENENLKMVGDVIKLVFTLLNTDNTVSLDRANLKKITKQNPSSLCKIQRGK